MLFGVAMVAIYGAGLSWAFVLVKRRSDRLVALLFKLLLIAIAPLVLLPMSAALVAPFAYDGVCHGLTGGFRICSVWEYTELQMMLSLFVPFAVYVIYVILLVFLALMATGLTLIERMREARAP